jgi:hypothetical protein
MRASPPIMKVVAPMIGFCAGNEGVAMIVKFVAADSEGAAAPQDGVVPTTGCCRRQ